MSMSTLRAVALAAITTVAGCDDDDDIRQSPSPTTPTDDIVDTASKNGSFNTLVAAVRAADLEATLRSPGPWTVFAPRDEAFTRLPLGTVETLLQTANREQLRSILSYHVVQGTLGSTSLATLTEVTTVNGQRLAIKRTPSGGLTVGDANVVTADIVASNGVIHVIDTVLIPK
jgi:uncharacterized surface protein with fasciclin (FAS1) repeats